MRLSGRVGVIGDVHAEDALLERALDWLSEDGVSATLCVGDIADGLGSLGRCCALLRDRGVFTVKGNHDRWILAGQARDLPGAILLAHVSGEDRRYLAELPATITFSTPRGPLLLCHGLGANDMAAVKPHDEGYALEVNDELNHLMADPGCRFVVNGHTHEPMVRHFGADVRKDATGRVTVVNAGTLKSDSSHTNPGFVVIDLSEGEARFYDLDGSAVAHRTTCSLSPSTS